MMDRAACLSSPDWVRVSTGESGAIVRRSADGARFAKVVDPRSRDDLAAERDRIAWLATQGILGPEVLAWHDGPDGACLVTSAVPGIGADRLAAADLVRAWPAIVASLDQLHALPVADCPFRQHDLTARMALARDVVARGAVQPAFLADADRALDPAMILADLERALPPMLALEAGDAVVCHGDPCLPNIMVDPGTLAVSGWIDLGRLGVADRHADLALLLANARETWPDAATARWAESVVAERHAAFIDADRLAFHLRLDPLTWG
ncbi:MAG: APH(3'') family aminoglycoside O-phosphotransferase [Thermomicrobiales bacterium]